MDKVKELEKKLGDCETQRNNWKLAYEDLKKRINKYPKAGITVLPLGKDVFESFLGINCEGYHLIAHAGKRFIQFLPPNMEVPITITTQIEQITDIARYEDDWLINPIKFRKKVKT